MAGERDMTTPVTRGEMHEALEIWAGAIVDKLTTSLTTMLTTMIDARFAAFAAEMRALVKTSERYVLDRVEAMFDPHRSLPERVGTLEEAALPERVSKLESKVFAPRRRASKSTRRGS